MIMMVICCLYSHGNGLTQLPVASKADGMYLVKACMMIMTERCQASQIFLPNGMKLSASCQIHFPTGKTSALPNGQPYFFTSIMQLTKLTKALADHVCCEHLF